MCPHPYPLVPYRGRSACRCLCVVSLPYAYLGVKHISGRPRARVQPMSCHPRHNVALPWEIQAYKTACRASRTWSRQRHSAITTKTMRSNIASAPTVRRHARDALSGGPVSLRAKVKGNALWARRTSPCRGTSRMPRQGLIPDQRGRWNVAVTVVDSVNVTVQAPVPEQAPVQPLKVEPLAGMALRLTLVPLAKLSRQSLPHAMPAGVDVTVPEPRPCFRTRSV
jgi:hypothetical protein